MSKPLDPFSAIVLAAGKGTRMKNSLPKVVHPVAGRPMIERVLKCVEDAGADEVRVVVGYGETLVRQCAEPFGAQCFKQEKQAGTADAVRSAQPGSMMGRILILNGDHPLMETADLINVMKEANALKTKLGVVTCQLEDPGEFGRIIRHQGSVKAIVENKDASFETKKIKEVNTGIYVISSDILNTFLPLIQSRNAQGEFYFTDIVSLAVEAGVRVDAIVTSSRLSFGVNTQGELAMATEIAYKNKVAALLENGVIIMDPKTTYVEESVEVAGGTTLFPNVFLRGKTKIGAMAVVEPNCFIVDSVIGDSVHIKAGCYLNTCTIETKAEVGPYAHLRPDTLIGEECKVGNFVEMKKTKFGKGAKASHLTYLGDAEIGEGTNIGCGTITCNYAADHKKYQTKIGKNVFVGSDTQFVAPITIGDNAIIGSGSTITKNVPAAALAVARGKQIIVENYKPREKKKE
jgi:bifunctional UDP-N-acetylglucosamine pyrophosphorylase / glucosamine-1-phosphate N-acetyltransferase